MVVGEPVDVTVCPACACLSHVFHIVGALRARASTDPYTHGHAQGQALSIGFVCSVCLSIFAKLDFSLCPMCESKVAIDRSAGAPLANPSAPNRFLLAPLGLSVSGGLVVSNSGSVCDRAKIERRARVFTSLSRPVTAKPRTGAGLPRKRKAIQGKKGAGAAGVANAAPHG